MSKVLVTGATGYVGGRLVPRLLERAHAVRCLVRSPGKLDHVSWRDSVEIVQGSVAGPLEVAMEGIEVAVYLVHGIGEGSDWVANEVRDAENFRMAAEAAGVTRIIYLGGMGRDDASLSEHLSSRHAVGRTLAAGSIPVVELRAAVIIGSGSASFEMLRYLVELLPVMVTPRWVTTRCQPIAIADVIRVLVAAIGEEGAAGGVYELGGPEVVTYVEMMELYAAVAGLPRRRLLKVPFLSPRLSSHWVGLVTPVPALLARELVESLVNEVTVTGASATERFGCEPMPLQIAFERARAAIESDRVPTSFVDADLVSFAPVGRRHGPARRAPCHEQRFTERGLPLGDGDRWRQGLVRRRVALADPRAARPRGRRPWPAPGAQGPARRGRGP